MKLTPLQQSGFILETDNGQRLGIDIGSYTPLEDLDGISLDSMIVSHIHGDHFSVSCINKLSPKKVYLNKECIESITDNKIESEIVEIKSGETIDIGGIKVQIFDVDHGPNVSFRPKENFGFLIEADQKKIYFAGDMFYESGINVSDLVIDFALIPVGGFYTFGPEEALGFVKNFKEIGEVIPMHYQKNPGGKEEFLKLWKI